MRQSGGSANGVALVAGTQEEAAVSLGDARSAGNRKVSGSWADVEDSGSDGDNSSSGCDFRAPHAKVEAQVKCVASEVDGMDACAGATGGTRKRMGRKSKATKGAIATSGANPTSLACVKCQWFQQCENCMGKGQVLRGASW